MIHQITGEGALSCSHSLLNSRKITPTNPLEGPIHLEATASAAAEVGRCTSEIESTQRGSVAGGVSGGVGLNLVESRGLLSDSEAPLHMTSAIIRVASEGSPMSGSGGPGHE